MARTGRVFGSRQHEGEDPGEGSAEAVDQAQGEPEASTEDSTSEATPEVVATPGEAAPESEAPEEVHNGYSGSGATLGLRLPTLRKVAKGESLQEKARKAEQEKAAAEGKALLELIAKNSPNGEWVEFEAADETEAKKYRRTINIAAETHERNFTVVIDGKLVQARMNRKTGAGRPKAASNGASENAPENASSESEAPSEAVSE